jgi:hypothetical protein
MVPLGFRVKWPSRSRRPREPALLVRVGRRPAFSPVFRVVGKKLRRRPRIIAIEPKPPRIIEVKRLKKPKIVEVRSK